jgi:hypothetical protein
VRTRKLIAILASTASYTLPHASVSVRLIGPETDLVVPSRMAEADRFFQSLRLK